MARIRLLLAVAITALVACAAAGISSALGAHDRAAGPSLLAGSARIQVRGTHRRNGHPRCARTVRVHAGGRYVLHRVRIRCRRAAHRPKPSHRRGYARSTPRHVARRGRPVHRSPRVLPPGRRTSAADVNGPCVDTQLTPTLWNLDRVRASMLCLVNRERAVHGESPLVPNAALAQAAQSHTESMAFGNYFEHIGPRGDTLVDPVRSAGYLTSSRRGFEVGENIAWGTLWLSSPRAIVASWMASPGHRANILDARFRDTAIGVSPHPPASLAHGQAGGLYTQDFGVITG